VTTGPIPFDEITDNGFQVQSSYMILPRQLQVFGQYSKIYGDNGDPYDITTGVWWYPFARRELRVNAQALYLNDSPVGYSSVPFAVGGNGWVFNLDVMVAL
jgi:hypothetical protein